MVGERAVAFTNAILRRGQVDGAGILAALDDRDDADLATRISMPEWMVERMRGSFGDEGIAALESFAQPRVGTPLRGNPLLIPADELDTALEGRRGRAARGTPTLCYGRAHGATGWRLARATARPD